MQKLRLYYVWLIKQMKHSNVFESFYFHQNGENYKSAFQPKTLKQEFLKKTK